MHRPRWTTVSIHLGSEEPALDGSTRLAALVRWLRRETPANVIVRSADGRIIHDPLTVNWDRFPVQEAIDAAQNLSHLIAPGVHR